jgi:hypothetical protein
LEELHLSLNNYSHVELGDEADMKTGPHYYHNVKKLHFTGNPVTTWREICKLGLAFPMLEALVLAECPLQSLDPALAVGNRCVRGPNVPEFMIHRHPVVHCYITY